MFKNIVGKRFGKLTAINYLSTDKKWKAIWLCLCDCGKTISSI